MAATKQIPTARKQPTVVQQIALFLINLIERFSILIGILGLVLILSSVVHGIPGYAQTQIIGVALVVTGAIGVLLRELRSSVRGRIQYFNASRANAKTLTGQILDCYTSLGEELVQTKERLTIAEERNRVLTDNLAAAVVVQEASGKFLFCSPYTEVLTGYSQHEIYSTNGDFFESVIVPQDLELYRRARRITAEGEPFQFRVRMRHKTGILIWVESRAVPIIGREDETSSSLSIHFDVTTSVRYQQQVEEKNRELQDLTHMVSHDLKAPLFTIKGMLDLIEEEGGDAIKNLREPLHHMQRASHRLEQLILEVLEYSRVAARVVGTEPVRLTPALLEVKEDFSALLRQQNGQIEIASDLPTVMADQISVVQVFTNLFSNAFKYRHQERSPHINICLQEEADPRMITVKVTDNGRGIPVEKLDLVFRPFQRFHVGDIEGSGMGLATVKKLMEKIGGDISVTSDGESGTSFLVQFRKAEE